jgi:hypothetical protein
MQLDFEGDARALVSVIAQVAARVDGPLMRAIAVRTGAEFPARPAL